MTVKDIRERIMRTDIMIINDDEEELRLIKYDEYDTDFDDKEVHTLEVDTSRKYYRPRLLVQI